MITRTITISIALLALGCGSAEGFYGRDGRPALGAQIDRTGRPAISTALVETFNGDSAAKDEAKDRYNAATPSTAGAFMGTVQTSLAILDALDATCGNQLLAGETAEAGRYETLATILLDDRLYVHTERTTCGTYLGLEAEVVGAVPEGMGGCGGRTPSDDVIERSYSVLAAGALDGVDDTVTADDGAQTPTFPFLGPPSE
ncbi:MAG: hypothetical protein VYE22_05030 [Myxococcota bacterium]|nr:hypothetical protein [Myxococcota bacterium]